MKTNILWLSLVASATAVAQAPQPRPEPATPDPNSAVAGPLLPPSNGGNIPPATSVDKPCAEAIGSASDDKSPTVSAKGAVGGPPPTAVAKETGCIVELPDKDKADQKTPQPER